MKIVLVRHGESEANDSGVIVGLKDVALSQTGVRHLEKMRDAFDYPKTGHYYTSELIRAKQTFSILYPGIISDGELAQFNEHSWGQLEGTRFDYSNSCATDWLHDKCLYGEQKFSDFTDTVFDGIKKLFELHDKEDSVTIVCHAGTIKAVFVRFLHIDVKIYAKLDIKNGMAYILDVDLIDGDPVLKEYSSLDHLPILKDQKKRSITFLNHEKTGSNPEEILHGSKEIPFCEEDKEGLCRTIPEIFGRYYSSDLKCCIKSFETLFSGQRIYRIDKRLQEFHDNHEDVPGKQVDFQSIIRKLIKGENSGLEDYQAFVSRLLDAVSCIRDEMIRDNIDSACVIAHDSVMRALYCYYNCLDPYDHCYNICKEHNGKLLCII